MQFAAFNSLTKLRESLFGLPFVLSGALLALPLASHSKNWLWILPAFLLARISGMAFNQLIDCQIDARNLRTQERAIPKGRVTLNQARRIAWGSSALFLFVCLQINTLTFVLSLIAALLIYIYSYTKRFFYFCHFVLGCIHLLGALMAYTALTGSCAYAALFLGGAALFSIAGNDIIYAIQDYEFDRANHLYSIPSRFGVNKALLLAALLHFVCLLMLLLVGLCAKLPLFYYALLPVAMAIFLYFHKMLHQKKGALKAVEPLFFFCNVAISFATLLFITSSSLWRVIS
jgi:4-hydroxybenzoate polyprenyltransferase